MHPKLLHPKSEAVKLQEKTKQLKFERQPKYKIKRIRLKYWRNFIYLATELKDSPDQTKLQKRRTLIQL